jgi:hypothetical protein
MKTQLKQNQIPKIKKSNSTELTQKFGYISSATKRRPYMYKSNLKLCKLTISAAQPISNLFDFFHLSPSHGNPNYQINKDRAVHLLCNNNVVFLSFLEFPSQTDPSSTSPFEAVSFPSRFKRYSFFFLDFRF